MSNDAKRGMNASFSALNSGMSAKWAAINMPKAPDVPDNNSAQDAASKAHVAPFNSSDQRFTSSVGASSEPVAKATTEDLNKKLAEMKAKF